MSQVSLPKTMQAGLADLAVAGANATGFSRITQAFLEDSPTVEALSARDDLGPEAYARHVLHWVDQGATIVGGCCETGPADIAEIAKQLKLAGHAIV